MEQYYSQLPTKHNDNSSFARSEYNALVQGVQRTSNPQGGRGYQDGNKANLQFDLSQEAPAWFPIYSEETIPVWSIFTIKKDPENNPYPFSVQVDKCKESNRPVLLANGPNVVVQGGDSAFIGLARIIDWFEPMKFSVHPDDTTNPNPIAGYPCGPINDSYEVALNGHGLLCLSIDNDNAFCLCVAAQPGVRLLVKPIDDIAAGDSGDVRLFQGDAGAEVAVDPDIIYTPFNRTSATCSADKFAEMVGIDGKLYIVPWECGTDTTTPTSTITPAR
jgi:hypothetical protein